MIKVGIIGGGATGLICASLLSKNKGIQNRNGNEL